MDSSNPPKTAIYLKVHTHRGALAQDLLSCRVLILLNSSRSFAFAPQHGTFPHQPCPSTPRVWRALASRGTGQGTGISRNLPERKGFFASFVFPERSCYLASHKPLSSLPTAISSPSRCQAPLLLTSPLGSRLRSHHPGNRPRTSPRHSREPALVSAQVVYRIIPVAGSECSRPHHLARTRSVLLQDNGAMGRSRSR